VFYGRDNGIGIPEKHCVHYLQVYPRLHGRDEFAVEWARLTSSRGWWPNDTAVRICSSPPWGRYHVLFHSCG
jgi:hypothetical protein